MTTADINIKTPPVPGGRFRLPDPPEHPDDKMTSSKHLSATRPRPSPGRDLGNPDTTLVTGERYIVARPARSIRLRRTPDLLVAFDADPAAYEASNGYIIEEQGKPPDFVLEIAPGTPGILMQAKGGLLTRRWAFWSTGGLTRRGSTTGRGWLATAWWTDGTNPSTLRSRRRAYCRDTARR